MKVPLGSRCLADRAVSETTAATAANFIGAGEDEAMRSVSRDVNVSVLGVVAIGDSTSFAGHPSKARTLLTVLRVVV
jgi:hypothetical protein